MKKKHGSDIVQSLQDAFKGAEENSPEIVDKIMTILIHKVER